MRYVMKPRREATPEERAFYVLVHEALWRRVNELDKPEMRRWLGRCPAGSLLDRKYKVGDFLRAATMLQEVEEATEHGRYPLLTDLLSDAWAVWDALDGEHYRAAEYHAEVAAVRQRVHDVAMQKG